MNYDEDRISWNNIFQGILSPFSNKYQDYIKHEKKRRKSRLIAQRKTGLKEQKYYFRFTFL